MITLKGIGEFSDLVLAIEQVDYTEEEHITKLKAKLRLVDASVLWIREIRKKEQTIAYSYYWLRSDDSLIIGWDNAPHHQKVDTYPHHKHIGPVIESSGETTLTAVLQYIKNFLS